MKEENVNLYQREIEEKIEYEKNNKRETPIRCPHCDETIGFINESDVIVDGHYSSYLYDKILLNHIRYCLGL